MRLAPALAIALVAAAMVPFRTGATDETAGEIRIDSPPMVYFTVRLPVTPNAVCSLRGEDTTRIEIDRTSQTVLFNLRSDSPNETTRVYLLDCVDGERATTRSIVFHTKFGVRPVQDPTIAPATPIPVPPYDYGDVLIQGRPNTSVPVRLQVLRYGICSYRSGVQIQLFASPEGTLRFALRATSATEHTSVYDLRCVAGDQTMTRKITFHTAPGLEMGQFPPPPPAPTPVSPASPIPCGPTSHPCIYRDSRERPANPTAKPVPIST